LLATVLPYETQEGNTVASITKKIKKGRPYYYAVESKRVDGKPRIVWQKYLGTIDAIIDRTEQSRPPKPEETVILQAGGVAALLRITQRLGLMDLINQVVSKREQGPSVGHYIVLAALNRALDPCSKLAIGPWYESTILRRLWRFPPSVFSSQRFWDHMGMISEEAIDTIQDRLLPRMLEVFGVDPRLLLYDTTNFFTFLASSNDRANLPQRGHAKSKRHDLRLVGLALLVSKDFQIPLLHRTYPGNIPDVRLFPTLSKDLIERFERMAGACTEATVVFDKGNVSDDAMEHLVVHNLGFVAALSAHRLKELLPTPLERFQTHPSMPGTRTFSTPHILWGKQCKLVLVYTESFFTQQLAGITQNLVRCQKKLMDLAHRLEKWRQGTARGKRPTKASVSKAVREILEPQFMKTLIEVRIEDDNGLPRLHYTVDHNALRVLTQNRLGRNILVTNRSHWTSKDVVQVYRGLTHVEQAFKDMKNLHFLHWQPAYPWTDQKLKVHGLYCVLALLLSSLARMLAARSGIQLTLPALLQELQAIREVAVIYPPGTLAHGKDHIALSRMSPRQQKLAHCLDLSQVLEG
jgi:transposase